MVPMISAKAPLTHHDTHIIRWKRWSWLMIMGQSLLFATMVKGQTLCHWQQGYAGVEGISTRSSDYDNNWHLTRPAFRSNTLANFFMSSQAGCYISDTVSVKGRMAMEYIVQKRRPGELEDRQQRLIWILNEAYMTWVPKDNFFVDVGKIRKSSSSLFSVAPLDLLRNDDVALRTVRVNALGNGSRSFYDEGSWGGAFTFYTDKGTWEAAILPKLVKNRDELESSVNWDSLERTNSTDRYYLSYSATGLTQFTPTLSLLLGTAKRAALGLNGNLNDNWILNVEGGISAGETWRHLHQSAAHAIWNYQPVIQPFNLSSQGINGDIGIGLRYSPDDSQTEYGIEYYAQSQGYSQTEWQDYLQTLRFIRENGNNPFLPASINQVYQQYARLFAAQTNNVNRQGYLLDKNYITLYLKTSRSGLKTINWQASGILNLQDNSSFINVHADSYLTNRLQVYSGINYTLGDSDTEFGLYGKKGNLYAGTRFLW